MIFKRSYKIPIYYGRLNILFLDDIKQVESEMNIELDHQGVTDYSAMVYGLEGGEYFAAFELNDFKPHIAAHEAKHLVNRIFNDVGMMLDSYNDEAECYLLGWIVKMIYKTHDKYERQCEKQPSVNN